MPATSTPSREARPGDGAEHRQAVVAAGVDACRPAARRCRARRSRRRSPRCRAPSAAQPVDDGRDPVGLLEPQLLRRRARRSRPRRSSRAAPTSGSSSIASGTSSGSTTVPHSGPCGDVEVADRLARRDPVAGRAPRGRRATMPPIRSRIRRKPVRVQLTPQSAIEQARAGDEHAGGDQERRRGRVAGDARRRSSGELVGAADASTRAPVAVAARRRPPASMPLGVVAARRGLDDRRRAVGQQPGEQHAGLDLRAGDRQLVVDRVQARAVDGERREAAVAWPRSGAHLRAAARRCGRPGGGGSTRRRRA